jgi:hypothetical protein
MAAAENDSSQWERRDGPFVYQTGGTRQAFWKGNGHFVTNVLVWRAPQASSSNDRSLEGLGSSSCSVAVIGLTTDSGWRARTNSVIVVHATLPWQARLLS